MHIWEIHPALVHFPIAFLTFAVIADLYALWAKRPEFFRYGTGLLVTGAATLIPAAVFGFISFFTVPAHTEDAHLLMQWHMVLNVCAAVLWLGLAAWRWRSNRIAPPSGVLVAIGACVLAMTLLSANLGGLIVYRGGAGIEPEILAPEIRAGHTHAHAHEHAEPEQSP